MISKLALLSSLFLASATVAVPSSRLAERIARRSEGHQTQPLQRTEAPAGDVSDVVYSSNWAGAVWSLGGGSFTSVTGTFTAPTPTGSDGSASAWVGIDGDSCQTAILQTGIDFTITSGVVSYNAWYEWYPAYAYDFTGFTINAGDVINATVVASSKTSGTAILENKTTGQTVTKALTSHHALCEQDGEWIVEDYSSGGKLVPFANFGTVTFSSASATGPAGTYTPSGATIIDIQQNGQVLTSVSTSGNTATIQYV